MRRIVIALATVSVFAAISNRSAAQYWTPVPAAPAAQRVRNQTPPGIFVVSAPQAPAAQPVQYQPPPGFVLVPAAQPQPQWQAQPQPQPQPQPQWQAPYQFAPTAQAQPVAAPTASAVTGGSSAATPARDFGTMRTRLTVGSQGSTMGAGNSTLDWDGDGGVLDNVDEDVSVDNTFGGFVQVEVPVHENFLVGGQVRGMSASLGGFERAVLDTNFVLQARLPLGRGRTELFLEVPFGFTWAFASSDEEREVEARDIWTDTRINVGWNVSALVGIRYMFGRVVGIEFAAGWGHHEAGYTLRLQPRNAEVFAHVWQSWNDVTSRLGLVFAF